MKVNNFRRLDQEQTPIFPTWERARSGVSVSNILGAIIGVLLWIALIFVFLVTLYLYYFQKNLVVILQALNPGNYHIPWWISLLLLIFAAPVTLVVIIIGVVMQGFKK